MEEEWTADANEAINISLVKQGPAGLTNIATFKPEFTYAIFGDEQRIFGYKGLKVNLQFNASDLRPHLSITSAKKFSTVGDIEALDVGETLKEYLPGVAFQSKKEYEDSLKAIPGDWTPPGTLLTKQEKNGVTCEVWHGSLADPAVRQLVKRIQIAVLFYIEGGSYIGEDVDGKEEPEDSLARWSVYFLYKTQPRPDATDKTDYLFLGYSTVYRFWMFQQPSPPASPSETKHAWELPDTNDHAVSEMPHRARISQFIILPPFQGKGAGSLLYNAIYGVYMNDAWAKEITVEDPNENFDLLRDLCDMKYLRKTLPEFAELQINSSVPVPQKGGTLHDNTEITSPGASSSASGAIVDIDALEKMRLKAKMAPRQFSRLVEMHLMSKLPVSVRPSADPEGSKGATWRGPSATDQRAYTLWRLLLKQRLYRRNATILGELATTERILKLNETVESVEWEYALILTRLGADPNNVPNGKRKFDGEDESSPSSKKVRADEA